jgi:hypothetical protein
LHLQTADRRRIAVATMITLVALPVLWLDRQDQAAEQGGGVAALVPSGAVESPVAEGSGGADFDESTGADPVFLGGPTIPPRPTAEIAYAADGGTSIQVRLDYARIGQGACRMPAVPLGERVTVTNVDNGRSTTCVNASIEPPSNGREALIDSLGFLELADLIDAPLTVRVSW